MKVKTTILLPGITAVLVVAAALLAVVPARVHATAKLSTAALQPKSSSKPAPDEKSGSQQPKESRSAAKSSPTPVSYTYTAQPGDSYTLFARKAIETYIQHQKLNVSQSRIVYAETNLTVTAGSPYLDLGQQESLSGLSVQNWVAKAMKLSDAQAALWDVYVPSVNFDMSGVGQAS